jgi:hypothetical protein
VNVVPGRVETNARKTWLDNSGPQAGIVNEQGLMVVKFEVNAS